MFLTLNAWNGIRENFSEEEKIRLNLAIRVEASHSYELDEDILGPELTAKLRLMTEGVK